MTPSPRVIAIAGASAGLGRALALALAAPGARLAVAARRADRLATLVDALAARGALAVAVPGDVRDPTFAARLYDAATHLGDVEALVTLASALGPIPLATVVDTSEAAWAAAVETNLLGAVRLWRAFLPAMEADERPSTLLALSSDAAVVPYPHWGAYGATKAAVDHLARILAAELDHHGHPQVKVYAVDPGDMDTELHRQAVPDADPASLEDPVRVAGVLARLLRAPRRPPSGRYTLAGLAEALA
jgi:NAD(P)-dependent dehydrogenase (short-subunit alcohol dehydrogenase family)